MPAWWQHLISVLAPEPSLQIRRRIIAAGGITYTVVSNDGGKSWHTE